MLNAGALIQAIMISLLAAIFSANLMLFLYSSTLPEIHNRKKTTHLNLLESAIAHAIHDPALGPSATPFILNDESEDTVWIFKRNWGLWTMVGAEIKSPPSSLKKISLYGGNTGEEALVQPKSAKKLYLTELSELTGKILISQEGIQSKNYAPTKGAFTEEKNKQELPRIDTQSLQNWAPITHSVSSPLCDTTHSFSHPTLVMHLGKSGILSHALSGNILVTCDSVLVVSRQAKLNGILLLAPIIIIERGFEGKLQAKATDSLVVEEDVVLKYPSSLALVKPARSTFQGRYMKIGNRSLIEGIVLVASEYKTTDLLPMRLFVMKESCIHGLVYSEGVFAHYGNVEGSVLCEEFGSAQHAERNVLDGQINRNKRSPDWVGPLWWNKEQWKEVSRLP